MASSAPAAVTQFIAIAEGVLPSDVQVFFDSNQDVYIAPRSLMVTGVHFNQDMYAELGPNYKHEEHYNLECVLWSAAGDNDQATRMSEVYSLYQAVQVAVASNADLNRTVRLAWCRQLDYTPGHDPVKGWSIGSLTFEVQCQARVTSLS